MPMLNNPAAAAELSDRFPITPEGTALVALLEDGRAVVLEMERDRERIMNREGTLSDESTRSWRDRLDWHPCPPRRDDLLRGPILHAMAAGGWTQAELADAVGMSQPQLSAFLRAAEGTNAVRLAAMLNALGLNVIPAKTYNGRPRNPS